MRYRVMAGLAIVVAAVCIVTGCGSAAPSTPTAQLQADGYTPDSSSTSDADLYAVGSNSSGAYESVSREGSAVPAGQCAYDLKAVQQAGIGGVRCQREWLIVDEPDLSTLQSVEQLISSTDLEQPTS